MRRRSVQSARLTLEAKSGFSHYWFTFTVFSARLSNWNSSGQIRQPLLCLTYFQQEVIFLTIFCYIFETQSALKGLWNIGEATVDWRFWPICHRISFASFCSQRPFTGKVIETSAQISLQRIKVVRSSFYPDSNISGEKICTHKQHTVCQSYHQKWLEILNLVARIQQVSVCCQKATLAWVWESLKKAALQGRSNLLDFFVFMFSKRNFLRLEVQQTRLLKQTILCHHTIVRNYCQNLVLGLWE